MISFLKLVRYPNLIMLLLTLVLTKIMLINNVNNNITNQITPLIFVSLLILIIAAAGYIVNDIFDVEADQINKPSKLYVTKTISVKRAWNYYWVLSSVTLILTLLYSQKPIHYFIFLTTPILLFLYSKYFKKIPLLGNIVISFLTALPIYIVYTYSIELMNTTNIEKIVLFYFYFAFITTLIREIIKDIEDVNGDFKMNLKTLPIIIGTIRTARITVIFTLILIVSLFFLVKIFYSDNRFLFVYGIIFLISPLLYFLYKLFLAKTTKDFRFLSTLIKLVMVFGILSMPFIKFN